MFWTLVRLDFLSRLPDLILLLKLALPQMINLLEQETLLVLLTAPACSTTVVFLPHESLQLPL